jgi:MFS family permease
LSRLNTQRASRLTTIGRPVAPYPSSPVLGSLGRYLGLLRERDFRRLWIAQSVSQVGSEVTLLALPLVAVLVLDASPFEVALLGATQFFAFIAVALPAGAWVDRLPRTRVLVTADLGRAAILLVVPFAALAHLLSMGLLYAVIFGTSILRVFFDVGYQAILPDLVERDRLAEGNSRLEVSSSAAQLIGPGIGGWLVGLVSAPIAIVVDALSFLGSAAFLVGIRARGAGGPDGPARPRPGIRREILEGLSFYRRTPLLRSLAATSVFYYVGVWFAGGTFIAYLARDLEMTPEAIGLGYSIGAVGVLVGAAAGAAIGRRLGIGRTLVASIAIGALSWAVMALAQPATALAFLALSSVGHGVTSMAMGINYVSLRQAITPAELQGRVNATGRWLNWTMIPLAAIGGGAVATEIGIRDTILIGSGIAFLAAPILLRSPLGSLRAVPPDVSPEAPSPQAASG